MQRFAKRLKEYNLDILLKGVTDFVSRLMEDAKTVKQMINEIKHEKKSY
ncbi:MAG: hypothetical protein PHF63_10845 [Herbinix sp.]|nr:hypothetical protein [Herbinix sp.]